MFLFFILFNSILVLLAPEAAPTNIRVKSLASISTLELEWERIPEDKANGIIRGYYVQYTATKLNGQNVEPGKQNTKTLRVRGNRYATILKNLIPGSTYEIQMFGYTIKNGTKSIRYTGGEWLQQLSLYCENVTFLN